MSEEEDDSGEENDNGEGAIEVGGTKDACETRITAMGTQFGGEAEGGGGGGRRLGVDGRGGEALGWVQGAHTGDRDGHSLQSRRAGSSSHACAGGPGEVWGMGKHRSRWAGRSREGGVAVRP